MKTKTVRGEFGADGVRVTKRKRRRDLPARETAYHTLQPSPFLVHALPLRLRKRTP